MSTTFPCPRCSVPLPLVATPTTVCFGCANTVPVPTVQPLTVATKRDVPPEERTRCYDCGNLISIACAERRNVQVGSGRSFGYGRPGSWTASLTRRVDLCRRCARKRDDWFRNLWRRLFG